MVNVCLIGCGGVGRRHLEAILKVKHSLNVEVVEPSVVSVNETKKLLPRFNNYFSSIDDVSDDIDICVVSTTSSVRKDVVLELVEKKNVKNIILEKVVFQNENDFDEVLELFKDNNIKSWVNCHLRAQPIYNKVKSCLKLYPNTLFNYHYSDDFTLSTSAIHILDLFSYLCDDYNLKIEKLNIDDELRQSRHSGCVDFNGEMLVTSGTHTLIVKKKDSVFGEIMTIANTESWIKASEGDNPDLRIGFVDWFNYRGTHPSHEDIPYIWQSSLTNYYIEDIIETSDCKLSTLENSSIIHKTMLRSFKKCLKEKHNREVSDCPIT